MHKLTGSPQEVHMLTARAAKLGMVLAGSMSRQHRAALQEVLKGNVAPLHRGEKGNVERMLTQDNNVACLEVCGPPVDCMGVDHLSQICTII